MSVLPPCTNRVLYLELGRETDRDSLATGPAPTFLDGYTFAATDRLVGFLQALTDIGVAYERIVGGPQGTLMYQYEKDGTVWRVAQFATTDDPNLSEDEPGPITWGLISYPALGPVPCMHVTIYDGGTRTQAWPAQVQMDVACSDGCYVVHTFCLIHEDLEVTVHSLGDELDDVLGDPDDYDEELYEDEADPDDDYPRSTADWEHNVYARLMG